MDQLRSIFGSTARQALDDVSEYEGMNNDRKMDILRDLLLYLSELEAADRQLRAEHCSECSQAVSACGEALKDAEYALFGSLVFPFYGAKRVSRDIGVLLAAGPDRIGPIVERLRDHSFVLDVSKTIADLGKACRTTCHHSGVPVRLFLPVEPVLRDVIALAQWTTFHGCRIRLASVESLVFMGIAELRNNGDYWQLLAANRGKLDFDIIRRLYSQVGEIGDERWQFLERVIRELDEEAARRSS